MLELVPVGFAGVEGTLSLLGGIGVAFAPVDGCFPLSFF